MDGSAPWTNAAFLWGALAFVLLALTVRFLVLSARLAKRVANLEAELRGAKLAQTQEFRMERFDALWYPTVTFSPASREVLKVVAGLPYCKSCLVPLSAKNGEWACSRCRSSYAPSLGDFTVVDGIAKTALGYFKERHPDYDLSAKK